MKITIPSTKVCLKAVLFIALALFYFGMALTCLFIVLEFDSMKPEGKIIFLTVSAICLLSCKFVVWNLRKIINS